MHTYYYTAVLKSYTDIKAKIDALVVEGYELEAYTTNSNLRNLGYLIGGDVRTIYYAVPNRTGISVLKPNGNVFDVENDANYISDQASVQGLQGIKGFWLYRAVSIKVWSRLRCLH